MWATHSVRAAGRFRTFWFGWTRILANLFAHLDAKVGRGNYVVALSADHGVVPVPEDMQKPALDAGVLHIPEVQEKIEKALEPFDYTKPAVARIASADVYFSTGIYDKLKSDPAAMRAVLDAIRSRAGRGRSLSRGRIARPSRDPESDSQWRKRTAISRAAAAIY